MTTHAHLSSLRLLVLFASASAVAMAGSIGPPCPTDTFTNYINNTSDGPGTGCTVAGPTTLEYTNFRFATSSNVGGNTDSSDNITVTPNGNTGFNFSGFQTVSNGDLSYYMAYDVLTDPAPVLTGDSIGLDPPSGNVTMSLYVCTDPEHPYINENGLNFYCGVTPNFTEGSLNQPIDLANPNAQLINTAVNGKDQATTFQFSGPLSQYGVLLVLTLEDGNPASVGTIGNTPQQISAAPEPSTWLMLGAGLTFLLLRPRRQPAQTAAPARRTRCD